MKPVYITSLEIENIKRISAVKIEPSETGLTIVGGDNRQGKTSVLDAIASALGGDKLAPKNPIKNGALRGKTTIKLNNGITVERTFTNKGTHLKVTDPYSGRSGQTLLNEFVSAFALAIGDFLNAPNKKKTEILLKTIGVDLTPYESKHKDLYASRTDIGRIRDRARKHAESLDHNPELGTEIISSVDVMQKIEEKNNVNRKNERHRVAAKEIDSTISSLEQGIIDQEKIVEDLKQRLSEATEELNERLDKLTELQARQKKAQKYIASLKDEDTTELRNNLARLEELNAKIQQNIDKQKAVAEAEEYNTEYTELTEAIENNQAEMKKLLTNAEMPLKGISVVEEELCFEGQPWDCMSGTDQLMVATAIVKKLNPSCGFVLIDKLEQMDLKTLKEFSEWLNREGLQAITTRVSQGEECSIIIENGTVKRQDEQNNT